MAKGNLFLGYGRGKVGSIVFSRRKGEQITRARNTAPANPKTRAQLGQRMKMYAPVKFYRQSLERFFKYAFTLGAHETVFNAFMRENIALAPWTAKNLVTEQAPVPYPARMSSGNIAALTAIVSNEMNFDVLPGTVQVMDNSGTSYNAAVGMSLGQALTGNLGSISQYLISLNIGLRAGDQLTFVAVGTKGLSIEGGNVNYNGTDGFEFIYKAFVIDPESTASASSLGFTTFTSADGNGIMLELPFKNEGVDITTAIGGCVIVTRSNAGKIDASNTSLVLNDYATSIYNKMRSEEYRAVAELSYKASDNAVLDPITTAAAQNS